MTKAIPSNASVATARDGGKLHAPSAARNVDALTDMLQQYAPKTGHALEIASGTGQHVVGFAKLLPQLHWHPTEIDPARRASIDAYVTEVGLQNVSPARDLQATQAGWGQMEPSKELIFLSNLLHLISTSEAKTLIMEAAQAVASQGRLILYGPFKRDGLLTSDGDERFDADLRAANPDIGYKDTADVAAWIMQAGLSSPVLHPMPANNLALITTKAAL